MHLPKSGADMAASDWLPQDQPACEAITHHLISMTHAVHCFTDHSAHFIFIALHISLLFAAGVPTAQNSPLRIKRATTETERAGILKAHADHLHVVQSYRATQTSLNHLSEEACSSMTGAFAAGGTGRLMKVDVDYVDQAKFKVPRNLDLTKSTEGLWRPQLHTGGILIWGVPRQISACQTWHATHLALACSHPDCCKCKVAEVYIIAEADLPKGSAAEVSLLARGLDEVGNEQL